MLLHLYYTYCRKSTMFWIFRISYLLTLVLLYITVFDCVNVRIIDVLRISLWLTLAYMTETIERIVKSFVDPVVNSVVELRRSNSIEDLWEWISILINSSVVDVIRLRINITLAKVLNIWHSWRIAHDSIRIWNSIWCNWGSRYCALLNVTERIFLLVVFISRHLVMMNLVSCNRVGVATRYLHACSVHGWFILVPLRFRSIYCDQCYQWDLWMIEFIEIIDTQNYLNL